jgi:hypothetical protein
MKIDTIEVDKRNEKKNTKFFIGFFLMCLIDGLIVFLAPIRPEECLMFMVLGGASAIFMIEAAFRLRIL